MAPAEIFTESKRERQFALRPWRELALVMLVFMEVSWVLPWFRSLTPATYAVSPLQGMAVLSGIMLVSLWVVRLMVSIRLRIWIRQAITSGLLLGGILVGLKFLLYSGEPVLLGDLITRPLRSLADMRTLIPDEFIIALTVLIGWWRGVSLAQEHIGPTVVRHRFFLGIVMFIIFGVVNTLITGETPGIFVFVFIFCALISMSAARISVLSSLRGGRQNSFDRRWFIGVILASILTVGLAFLFGDIFSRYFQWIAVIFMGIIGLLALLIWLILAPLLAVVIRAVDNQGSNLQFIQQLSDQFEHFQQMMRDLARRFSESIGAGGAMETLLNWGPGIKGAILGGVLLAVVVGILIWVAFQISAERKKRRIAEEQQGIFSSGEFWQLLQSILRQRWQSLVSTFANAADLRGRARRRAAERVRQVYADLMELCDELGHPRPEAQTPLEFLPDLIRQFPPQEDQVTLLTRAYLKVRYGELPETHQEVQAIEAAWEDVSHEGKNMLEARKHQKKEPEPGTVKHNPKPRSTH